LRACQIANATGWKEPEGGRLKALVIGLVQSTFDAGDASSYLNVATVALNYNIATTAEVALQAEALSRVGGLFPDTARHLLELAGAAYRSEDNEGESNRCLALAAECYVAMAEAADSKGMTAASWLMDAIKALRHLPGTRQRRTELEAKLREAQAAIADEMGVISTP
jgi:hypothetical protein